MHQQLDFGGELCPTCAGNRRIFNRAGTEIPCPACAAPPPLRGFTPETAEGITRVDEHADDDWKERAAAAVYQIALAKQRFTPDDLWDRIEKPREPRALGPVMLRAKREGWIEATGERVVSRHPTQHQNEIKVWRSLIYGRAA